MSGTVEIERDEGEPRPQREASGQVRAPIEGLSWAELSPGDDLRVQSLRGNEYRLTLVARVGDLAYARCRDNRLARLERARIAGLKRLGQGPALVAGDRILGRQIGGSEVEGHLVSGQAGHVALEGRGWTTPWAELEPASLRLCFRAPSPKVGEEIRLSSPSGTSYRGYLEALGGSLLALRIGEEVLNLKPWQLDLCSLIVLVPLESLGCRSGSSDRTHSLLSRLP